MPGGWLPIRTGAGIGKCNRPHRLPESAAGRNVSARFRPMSGCLNNPGQGGNCSHWRQGRRRPVSSFRLSGHRSFPDTAGYISCPYRSWGFRWLFCSRLALKYRCGRSAGCRQPPRKGAGRTGTRSGSCSCCCGSRLSRWFPAWPLLPQRSGAARRFLPCSLFPAVSGAVNSAIRLSRFLTSFPCPVIRAARS